MARRKAPQNKAHQQAPENKEPFTEEDQDIPAEEIEEGDPDGDDELTEFVDRDSQLRRLLKAENNQWSGVISRQELRTISDRIRRELRGEVEVEEEGAND